VIAATAIAAGLPIYTCNTDHFRGIDDLEVVALPIPPTR
jgi:predicted nucleic acid-binding protein